MKKMLVFITTLLTIVSLAFATILPANAQTTPVRHTKVERKNKPYPKTLAAPATYNTISFDDQNLPIGEFTLPNIYSDRSTSQATLNAGHIIQGYYPIDVNDGKTTYLAGHNPGIFSPLAAYAQIGKTVTIHDRNGNAKTYRFTNMIPTSLNGLAVSPDVVDYMNTHMSDHEGLVIQWCRRDLNQMQLWILDPVA